MPSPATDTTPSPSPLDGIVQAVRDGYYALEDRYYNLLDRIAPHVPVYSIVDPIDRVVPSFIVFSLLFIALLLGIGFVIFSALFGGFAAGIQVTTADGLPVPGAHVELLSDVSINGQQSWDANADGYVMFHLSREEEWSFRISAPDFEDLAITHTFLRDASILTAVLSPADAPAAKSYRLDVQDFSTNSSIFSLNENKGKEGSARLSCASNGTVIAIVPIKESSMRLSALDNTDCTSVQVTVEFPGYVKSSAQPVKEITTVLLKKVPAQQVNLTVRAMDQNGSSPLAGLKVIVSGSTTIAPQLTDSSGTTVFALAPSIYTIKVIDESAAYEQPADQSVDLTGGSNQDKIFVLKKATPSSQKKIFLRMFDSNSRAAVLAWVSIYQDNVLLDTARSTTGDYSYALADGNQTFTYSAVVSHEDYLTKVLSPVPLRALNDSTPTDVNLVRVILDSNGNPVNAFQLNVKVLADNNSPVSGAHVQLFDKRFSFPVDQGDSLDNGLYRFFNLPAATYYATAENQGATGKSIDVVGRAGEIKDVNIVLVLGTVTIRATVVTPANVVIADANVVFTTNLDQNALVQLTSATGVASGAFKVNRIVTIRVDKAGYESVQLPPIDLHGLREPAVQNVKVILFPVDAADSNLSLRLIGILNSDRVNAATTFRKGESYWLQYRLRAKEASTNAQAYVWAGKEIVPLSNAAVRITDVLSGATTYSYYSDAVLATPFLTVPSNLLSQPPAKRSLLNYDSLPRQVSQEFFVKIAIDNNESTPADSNIDLHYGAKTATPALATGDYVKSFQLGKPLCLVLGTACPPIIITPYFQTAGSATNLATRNGFYELSPDFNYNFFYTIYNASNQNYATLSTRVTQSNSAAIILDGNVFVISGGLQPSQTAQSPNFLAQPVLESENASFTILVDRNLTHDANELLVPIKVVPKKNFRVDYSRLFKDVPYSQTFILRVMDASDVQPVANALVSTSFIENDFTGCPTCSGTTDSNGETSILLDVGTRNFVYVRVSAPGFETRNITVSLSAFDPSVFSGDPQWPCLNYQSSTGENVDSIHVTKDSRVSFRVVSTCETPVDVSLFVQTAPLVDCYPSLMDATHGIEIPYSNGQAIPSLELSPSNPSNEYRFSANCLKGVYGIRLKAREHGSTNEFSLGKRLLAYVDFANGDCFSLDDARFDLSENSNASGVATNYCPLEIQNTLAPQFNLTTDLIGVVREKPSSEIPIVNGTRDLGFTVSNISGQDDIYSLLSVRDYVAKTTKLDVVFLLDSSTSMASLDPVNDAGSFERAYQIICDDINHVLDGLRSERIVINKSIYGMGRLIGCASRVADWGDNTVTYSKGPFNNVESWAPSAQFVINNHEWDPESQKAIVIVTDNAPGGRNNVEEFSHCEGTADGNCYWPVESVSNIVQNTIAAARLKNVRIIVSRLPALEGLNATLRHRYGNPTELDAVEAMEAVAAGSGGRLVTYPVGASDVYVNQILDAIYPLGEERFHVLFETGQPACYGPTNVAGQAGPLAVPRVSWSWDWASIAEDACSPTSLTGVQNPHYVYCDTTQFTTSLMKRLHQMDMALHDQNLLEFSNRQSFLVALKKDGFTADFRHDYNLDLQEHQLLAGDGIEWFINSNGGFEQIFSNPNFFKMNVIRNQSDYTSDQNHYTLDEPGIYYVQIVPRFINAQDRQFYINGTTKNVILKIHLTKVQDPQDNNPFYYMPFDGRVGINDATNRFERDGYGVAFDGSDSIPIYQRTIPLYTLQTYGGSAMNENIATTWNQSIQTLNGAQRGVILSAQYDSVQKKIQNVAFSPAQPTPVIVGVRGTTGNPSTFGYVLKSNDQVVDFPATSSFITQWTQIANSTRVNLGGGVVACRNFNGGSALINQPDARMTSGDGCSFNSAFSQKVFGLNLGSSQTAENYYRTTFYRPINSNLSLQQSCASSTSTFYSPAGATTETSPILSLTFNPQANGGPFPELGDWKAIFDYASQSVTVNGSAGQNDLFTGYPLCVYKNANEIQFFWNNAFVNALSQSIPTPNFDENVCPLPAYVR